MCKINLQTESKGAFTVVSNNFIDNFMKDANGTYVKVYLYLLRCLSDSSVDLSLSLLADKLEETEGDVLRALKYWEKVHVLSLRINEDGEICGIALVDLNGGKTAKQTPDSQGVQLAVPALDIRQKPVYSSTQLDQFKASDDFNDVINYIEDLYRKPITKKELQTPAFLFECLGLSGDFIKYLFEYCHQKGKTSFAYIEKVACDWYDKGIKTVNDARKSQASHDREFAAVRKAFGLSRDFGAMELKLVLHWCNELHFDEQMITEGCNRTIMKAGKPDFNYANGIFEKWYENGVTTLEAAASDDAAHKLQTAAKSRRESAASNVIIPNKFNNYSQRQYSKEELDSIEARWLSKSN